MCVLSSNRNFPLCDSKQHFVLSSYICWHPSALNSKCDMITQSVKTLNIEISPSWPWTKIRGRAVPFLCCTHNYWRLQPNHFHMGSMKTLQSLPQYKMRWLCLASNQQRKEEWSRRKWRGESLRAMKERRDILGNGFFFVKSLFFNHQFLYLEFLFQNLSNWKQMLWVRPHENKKTFLLFPNPPPEKSWLRWRRKEWASKDENQNQLQHHSK